MRRYELSKPAYGFLPEELIIAKLDAEQYKRLYEHALAFACLDGNAFDTLIDQYLPEAYANLWQNSHLDGLPLLYPSSAHDAAFASMYPSHPQYHEMDDDRRAELRAYFKVKPDGDPLNMSAILDKAEAVLGTEEAALDWVDQFSSTLEGFPRELSNTAEGTNKVLRHLAGISHHGGVDV